MAEPYPAQVRPCRPVQTAEVGPWDSVEMLSGTRSPRSVGRGCQERCWCKSGLEVGCEPEVNFEHRCSFIVPQLQLALALAYDCCLETSDVGGC